MKAVIGAGLPIAEPKQEDVLNIFARFLKISINCIKIGTVQSIDYTKMTATIQIVFQQALRDGTFQNIPVLTDCPVFTLQGGGYSLQFPIEEGDTAIVLFSDRNIDNWFQSGGVQVPADGRLHNLSDAIAIVGLNSLATPLSPAPTTSEVRLTNKAGNAKVGINSAGKVTVAGTSGQTLLTALQTLITGIQGLQVVVSGPGTYTVVDATTKVAQGLIALQGLLY